MRELGQATRGVGLIGLWLAAALPIPAAGRLDESAIGRAQFRLRVFNYAGISPRNLARAQGEARRIFAQAGVSLQWIDCPLQVEQAAMNPVCRVALDPTEAVVRLQPRFSGVIHSSFGVDTAGYASLRRGERGSYVTIFCDRVAGSAQGKEFTMGLILGITISHEVGHLLLRTLAHSQTGIMRAQLDRGDLKDARIGHLVFTPELGAEIRSEILRRGESGTSPTNGE